jgi:hypothetical protein
MRSYHSQAPRSISMREIAKDPTTRAALRQFLAALAAGTGPKTLRVTIASSHYTVSLNA